MADRYVVATGNWSSTGTWSATSGGASGASVPGDGDMVIHDRAYTVTIDQDLGTNGNGIRQIFLTHLSAVLKFEDAPAAARTVRFASTGANPLGGGAWSNGPTNATWDSATMMGFVVAAGTLNLQGTASIQHTITTGDGTNRWYCHHGFLDAGVADAKADVTLKFLSLLHIGENVSGAKGVDVDARTYLSKNPTINIDYCFVSDYYNALFLPIKSAANTTPCSLSNNWFTLGRDDALSLSSSTLGGTFTINDNTLDEPRANNKLLCRIVFSTGSQAIINYNRNVAISDAAQNYLVGNFQTGGLPSGSFSVSDNLVINLKNASPPPGFYFGAGGCLSLLCSGNIMEYTAGLYHSIGTVTNGTRYTKNICISNSYSATSQAGLILAAMAKPANAYRIDHNISVIEGTPGAQQFIFGLQYSSSGNKADHDGMIFDHNTGYAAIVGATTTGLMLGEGGFPIQNAIARNNILVNHGQGGIYDYNTPSSQSTYALDFTGPSGLGAVGVHHNCVSLATNAYRDNGGTNFDDGTHQHPSAEYGDLTIDPQFVDPTRNVASWAAMMGKTGTDAEKRLAVIAEFTKRCGQGGAYNSNFAVPLIRTWIAAGFVPQNKLLKSATDNLSGLSEGWIGAEPGPSDNLSHIRYRKQNLMYSSNPQFAVTT